MESEGMEVDGVMQSGACEVSVTEPRLRFPGLRPLRSDLSEGGKGSRCAHRAFGRHGARAQRVGEHFESQPCHGRDHDSPAQVSGAYPLLASFGDAVAPGERSI